MVFTSGGIGNNLNVESSINFLLGPTHDDITYDSIAEAFDVPLIEHKPTINSMIKHYKTDSLNKEQMRMATLPQADAVYETPGLWVPLVKTKNVMILPGVPLLFKRMIDNWFEKELAEYVKRGDLIIAPRTRISVKTYWKESDLAEKLTQLQILAKKFDIALGSYPKLFDDDSTFVVISISGPLDFNYEIEKIANEIIDSFEGEIFNQ